MISKKYIAILFTVFIATLGIFISSCDISDPTEGLEVRLKTISRETTVNVFLKDAVDNSVIRQSAKVTFEGSNSGQIIDVNNRAQTSFTTTSGFITFSVKDGTSFDENSPFEVNVRLETAGYNSLVTKLSIYSKGISSNTLFMFSPNNLPADTYEGNASGGTTDNSGVITTDTTTTTDNGTSVSLTAGTTLTTSAGVPLVGSLTTSIQIIPLSNNNIAPSVVSGSGINAVPAFQIEIDISDQSGNSATNISNDVVVELPITASDINPATGQAYQVGDKAAMFLLTDDSGSATKIGEGEVISTNSGLAIQVTINAGTLKKTSKVNSLGSGIATMAMEFNYGSYPCRVVLESTQQEISSYSFEVFLDGRSKGSYSGSQFLSNFLSIGGVGFNNILTPANVQVKYQGITVVNTSVDCGNNDLSFNLSAIPTTFTINFAANGVCTDKDPAVIGQLSDAAYTYYPVNNPNDINTGVVKDGSGSVTFSPGSYTIEITYDGDTYSGNIAVSSGGVVTQEGFDTSNLYYGDISINGTRTTLNASNNPNIQGTNVTVYVSIDCN